MAESVLVRQTLLALSDAGCTVWRQNTGMGWAGTIIGRTPTTITLLNPRPLHAGLCVGSGDLIGIAPDGRFLSVEVKAGRGRPTSEQLTFQDAVLRARAIAGIVWSVDEALALIDR